MLLVEYPLTGIILFGLWWFFGWKYLVVGIAVFALLFFIDWKNSGRTKKRVNIAQGDFHKYLETLFYRGYDHGAMIVEAPDEKRYMQFTKHILDQGVFLQFQFPRAAWSTPYYEPLKDLLNRGNYYYQVHQVRPEEFMDHPDEFIVVALEQKLEAAVALAKLVLLEIFKLDPSDDVLIWYGGLSTFNKKVGFEHATTF